MREQELKITEIDKESYSKIFGRAKERIEEAIVNGIVRDQILDYETEVFSFPVAVMMVAAANDSFFKRRYALAEAKRVSNILKQENKQKLTEVAKIFNWKMYPVGNKDAISQAIPCDFTLYFTDFIKNASNFHDSKWKLINRAIANGEVYLAQNEVARLLEEEVRAYVEKKLDLEIDIALPQTVIKEVERLKQLFISRRGKMRQEETFTETVLEAFPPCMRQLYNLAPSGSHISHIGRFALTSFLLNTGMSIESVIECFRPTSDFSEKMTRYQVEHIAGGRGSRTKYTPPRCDTLRTHGICPGMDEICRERVRHPLAYYRRKLTIIKNQAATTTTQA